MNRGLPENLQGLLRPEAYPHPVAGVRLIETHVSWILLTGALAYKIKRPVRFAFVDLSLPERRAHFCEEELRLNRRFAPQLYEAVVAIRRDASGQASLRGTGEIIEHAVRMKQFDREEELDRLLLAGRIEPEELARFGAALQEIHAVLPTASPFDGYGTPHAIRAQHLENLEQLGQAADGLGGIAEVGSLRADLSRQHASLEELMSARLERGFVRECHGDLHSRNIVRLNGRLVAFDCMEFEPAFRWIDVAEEVAFLCADLRAIGYPAAAYAFLSGYVSQSGDYEILRLLDLYQAHRALVRAKVAALSAGQVPESERQQEIASMHRYVAVARESLATKSPRMILMSGLSGSGKTWLASRLAPRLQAIHLRSDVERKRRAGLSPTTRAGAAPRQGLYSEAATDAVYEHLAQAAEHVVAGGHAVIVDATFGRRKQRDRFRALAASCGAPLQLVRCHASPDVLRERIRKRAVSRSDASDADVAVLEWQERHAEAIDPGEELEVIEVRTSPAPQPSIEALLRRLGGRG